MWCERGEEGKRVDLVFFPFFGSRVKGDERKEKGKETGAVTGQNNSPLLGGGGKKGKRVHTTCNQTLNASAEERGREKVGGAVPGIHGRERKRGKKKTGYFNF